MTSARRVLQVGLALLLLLLAGGPTLAQESGTRDPLALARRLGGLTGEVPLSPLTPRYQAGAREAFYVSRPDAMSRSAYRPPWSPPVTHSTCGLRRA